MRFVRGIVNDKEAIIIGLIIIIAPMVLSMVIYKILRR